MARTDFPDTLIPCYFSIDKKTTLSSLNVDLNFDLICHTTNSLIRKKYMTLYKNYIVTSIILTRTVVNQLHQQAYADGSVLLLKMSDVFYHDQVA